MEQVFQYLNGLPLWVVVGGTGSAVYLFLRLLYNAEIKKNTHPDYKFVPGCFTILLVIFLLVAFTEFRHGLTGIF